MGSQPCAVNVLPISRFPSALARGFMTPSLILNALNKFCPHTVAVYPPSAFTKGENSHWYADPGA